MKVLDQYFPNLILVLAFRKAGSAARTHSQLLNPKIWKKIKELLLYGAQASKCPPCRYLLKLG